MSITILMLITSPIANIQYAQATDENLILINEFILNDTASYPPHILKINDDGLFAISYLTADRLTSIIQTISIDNVGMDYYEIDMINFPSGGISSTIEKLGNDRYLLWGNGLYTVTISDTGNIGELSEKFSIYRGHGGDFPRPIVSLDDDTFLIAHQYRATTDDFPGLIEVFHITDDGNLSRISELLFEPEYGVNPSPVKVDSDTIAVAYQDRNDNKISTFDISNLTDIQLIQSTSVESAIGNIHTLIHISNNVYAFQTTGSSDQIQTIVIDNDGIIGSIIYSSSLSSSVGTPAIIHFEDDLYVTAYKDYPDYLLKLVSITDNWISVQDDQTSFGTGGTSYSNPIYSMSSLNDEILVVLYTDIDAGTLSLFTYYISSPPTITSLVADDPDDLDDVYYIEDTITITFDSDTNTPGGDKVQIKPAIDDMFTFSEFLGRAYSGWWTAPDTFVITIHSVNAASPPIISGTTVTPAGITPILSADGLSESSSAISPVLSGDFGIVS